MKKIKKILLRGEPLFGSIYDQAEIQIVNKLMRESIDPSGGFVADREVCIFEEDFRRLCECRYAVALNGAGSAIDLVLKALDIKPGDEIISCAINFHGTHLAIIGSGAQLVLAEPTIPSLNIDPEDVRKKISSKTRAILVTYMNGLAADVNAIKKVINSSKYFKHQEKPKIICDAARSLGTTYCDKHIGGEAWATIFSFHSYKMITTLGEGGMVLTNDKKLANHLMDYRSFGRGHAWGSNYKLTKLQAGVGHAQLKKLKKMVKVRRLLANQRHRALCGYPEIQVQGDINNSLNCYYLYTIILPSNKKGEKRDEMIKILQNKFGIGCAVANRPTYQYNTLIKSCVKGQRVPLAEDLGERIICPIIHPAMSKEMNQ
jgi:perosamine synthetase